MQAGTTPLHLHRFLTAYLRARQFPSPPLLLSSPAHLATSDYWPEFDAYPLYGGRDAWSPEGYPPPTTLGQAVREAAFMIDVIKSAGVTTNRVQRNPLPRQAEVPTTPSVPMNVFPHQEIKTADVVVQIPHPKAPGKITYLKGKVKKVPCRMANTLVVEIPGFDNTPLEWVEKANSNDEGGNDTA